MSRNALTEAEENQQPSFTIMVNHKSTVAVGLITTMTSL